MPTIAVVIPTYNRSELAAEAARSALGQSLPDGWSHVVAVSDDGSTDDTVDRLCAALGLTAESDGVYVAEGVALVVGPNVERGAARNRGVAAVARWSPDWLLFLDSDDELAPDGLRRLVDRVESADAEAPVAVYGNFRSMTAEGVVGAGALDEGAPEGDVVEAVCTRQLMSPGSTMIRADTFGAVGGFSEDRAMSGSEDWHLWLRLALAGPVLHAPGVVYHYRRHESVTPPARFADSVMRSRDDGERILREASRASDELLRRMRTRAQLLLAGTYNSGRETGKAVGHALRVLVTDPAQLVRPSYWRLLARIGWRGLGL